MRNRGEEREKEEEEKKEGDCHLVSSLCHLEIYYVFDFSLDAFLCHLQQLTEKKLSDVPGEI